MRKRYGKLNVLSEKETSEDKKIRPEDSYYEKILLRVYRGKRNQKSSVGYSTFEIPVRRWTTVLDALLYAKGFQDSSLAIRYSCRMASCGSCGMKINGVPRLACYTKISELDTDIITCEPLANFPHIRDLVTDFSQFFGHHKRMRPFIQNVYPDKLEKGKLTEFQQTPNDVDKFLQFSYCIKCGLCYSACPTVATDTKFAGPQALSQAYRYFIDSRDNAAKERLDLVNERHGIWRCHFAGSCSSVCPKGVDPALGIQLLRSHLLSFSKNEKKLANLKELKTKNNNEHNA